ncbi:MAG: lipopolysaccharide kinase InaA family protein, partial [Selenomonas sp.]
MSRPRLTEAVLADGRKIPYVITENPPQGGMKYTYFAPDKSYVVQFFLDPDDIDEALVDRLTAIIGRYNPTLAETKGGARGNTVEAATYFADLFCWPTAIVTKPEFGIVCPAYPKNFFFGRDASRQLDLAGKDKKGSWFTSRVRKYLEKAELGNFQTMLRLSIALARAVRRMHQAGLAHSDLSCNNVLVDPKSGSCVVIDIDSLVVPGLYP